MESEKEKKEIVESWYKIVLDSKDLDSLEKNYANFYSSLIGYKPYKLAWNILESECDKHYSDLEKECKKAMYEYLEIQKRHERVWKGLFENSRKVNENDYLPEKDFVLITEDELNSESVHNYRVMFRRFTIINRLLDDLHIYKPLEIFEGKFFEPDFKVEKIMYEGQSKEVQRLTFTNPLIFETKNKLHVEHERFLKGRSGKDLLVLKALWNHINTKNIYELYKNIWLDDCVNDVYCLFVFKDYGRSNIEKEVNKIKECIRNTYFHIKEIAIVNQPNSRLPVVEKKRKKIIRIVKSQIVEKKGWVYIKKADTEVAFKSANLEGKFIRYYKAQNTNTLSQRAVFRACYGPDKDIDDNDISEMLVNISKKIIKGNKGLFAFSIPETGTNRVISFGFSIDDK